MSNETNIVADTVTEVTTSDDLDLFSADFFGQKEAEPDKAKSEDQDPVKEDALSEDTHNDADVSPDKVDTDAEVDETDPEATPEADKPKKSRFQERIDELTAAAKQNERRAEEAERRLQELEAKSAPKELPAPANQPTSGPSPSDLNEDGTDKYPLGEFDPSYLRDFVKHLHEIEKVESAKAAAEESRRALEDAQQAELRENWNTKLAPAQERYPDFMEKGQTLVNSFSNLDASYGEFLTASLMSMDNGPDVLYYLSSNIEEAKAIVAGGPVKAAVAFGTLSERLKEKPSEKPPTRPIKESKAPPPPPSNKGLKAATPFTPDTDDLDAFAAQLFRK